jgi:16S rRNA processing protein RimM
MSKRVVLGRIVGVYGVRGWVRVLSETEPREAILGYSPWNLGATQRSFAVIEGRRHGKGVIARLAGCDDRDQAASLVDQEIAGDRGQLPPSSPDEPYWADLEGLEVWVQDGSRLGVVDHLFSTGVNDVLVVSGERERLIPFAWGDVVKSVDLEAGRIEVDWDPDF